MAVVGTLAKGRKFKWRLYMIMSILFSAYCAYDGFFNEAYKTAEKQSDQMFNQVLAIVLAVAFIALIIGFFVIKKTRVVVDEKGVTVNNKPTITWASVTDIDDSREEKGLLDIFYTANDKESKYILDSYKVDHFDEILDEISVHRPDLLTPLEDGEEA